METLSYCQLMERCLTAEARVAELESRTVKLPKRYSCEGYHIDEAYLQEDPDGIRVIEGEV